MDELEPLNVIEWNEASMELEEKKSSKGVSERFKFLYSMLQKYNFVVVELGRDVSLFSIFTSFFSTCSADEANTPFCSPLIGVVTPFDLEEFKDKMHDHSGAWISMSHAVEGWVAQKFDVIRPVNVYEVNSFINKIGTTTEQRVVFLADFLNEIHESVDKKTIQSLLSSTRTNLKSNNDIMFLFIQSDIFKSDELSMLELYADAILRFSKEDNSVTLIDKKTNKKTKLGTLSEIL